MHREELDAIRKRAEAATPGQWEVENNNVNGPDTGYGELRVATLSGTARIEQSANADFIANARQDVPALLAEVERLRAILEPLYIEGILSREEDE